MTAQDRFREDMEKAGFRVVEVILSGCEGEVPGVCCLPLELQTITQATEVPVQIEQLGQGFVVFPR
jgi:hypothetical protein